MPARRFAAVLVALLLLVAGCSDNGDDETSGEQQLETPPAPSDDTTAPGTDTSIDPTGDPGPLRLTEVAAVPAPTALAAHPQTGELYVAEQTGRVHRLADGESAEVIDISSGVTASGERGLLGLAFDPAGNHLYLSYTNAQGDTRLDEYEWVDGDVVEDSRREILAVDQPFPNHNGGQITFGPDGYLYLGLGDGGSAGDPNGTGQDTSDLLGSLLRIDPGRSTNGEAYAIPDGNPFADGGGSPEVWLYGVRNPWRFSFDRETGDLWIGDVGQDSIEEIDFLPAEAGEGAGAGANLGWSAMEGSETFKGTAPDDQVLPIHEYSSNDGNCSVTGGYVYRGANIPALEGTYLYGDYCAGELRVLRMQDDTLVDDRILGLNVGGMTLASFGEDLDGELYVLSVSEGKVYRLDPG